MCSGGGGLGVSAKSARMGRDSPEAWWQSGAFGGIGCGA